MKITKSVLVEKDKLSEVICNKCGKSFNCGDNNFNANLIHGFNMKFGYGSPHDLEEWKFDLCETCIDWLTGTFVIEPTKFEIGPFGESYGREIKKDKTQ